jgi:hypothetical protein
MIRKAMLLTMTCASLALTGCSAVGPADAATSSGDMYLLDLAPRRLTSGVWKVVNAVVGNAACQVNPGDPANPATGQIWALVNDSMGGIKLGNATDPAHPGAVQQYDTSESGTPPQPAQGASCPGGAANQVRCASEGNAQPFGPDGGTLVRDNQVGTGAPGTCTFHRHLVNQVYLTGDQAFTAQYTSTDTQHMSAGTPTDMAAGCAQTTDCTTTASLDFIFVKGFNQ